MALISRTTALVAIAATALLALAAQATNYSLWINGRGGGGTPGNHADWRAWGPATVNAGVNKKAVNWDGFNRISTTNGGIRDALDCYCTGPNWCYIAAYSAGNLQIGYALSLFGTSQRFKKNPTPNSAGQCSNSDGGTQTGWNIKWVNVAGGAGGGSELADAGDWARTEAATLRAKSPETVNVALGQLREGRAAEAFEDNMRMEFRIGWRKVQSADFLEGVRAVIIDKDNAPVWKPARLEDVTEADVARYFAPLGADELTFAP
jgi:hypothetical protein